MLLWVHIAFGAVALMVGAVTLYARKGGRVHIQFGTMFAFAMIIMGLTGTLIGAEKPERDTALIGLFTAYLVATSWATARNKGGRPGWFEWLGLAIAVSCAATFTAFSMSALESPSGRLDSLPASAHYPFVVLASLAAALDLNHLLRKTISPRQRLARHLWRMCAAFLIAALSFFIGQQDEMPALVRGSPLLFVPEILIMGALVYWLVRLRFPRQVGWLANATKSAAAFAKPAAAWTGGK